MGVGSVAKEWGSSKKVYVVVDRGVESIAKK